MLPEMPMPLGPPRCDPTVRRPRARSHHREEGPAPTRCCRQRARRARTRGVGGRRGRRRASLVALRDHTAAALSLGEEEQVATRRTGFRRSRSTTAEHVRVLAPLDHEIRRFAETGDPARRGPRCSETCRSGSGTTSKNVTLGDGAVRREPDSARGTRPPVRIRGASGAWRMNQRKRPNMLLFIKFNLSGLGLRRGARPGGLPVRAASPVGNARTQISGRPARADDDDGDRSPDVVVHEQADSAASGPLPRRGIPASVRSRKTPANGRSSNTRGSPTRSTLRRKPR